MAAAAFILFPVAQSGSAAGPLRNGHRPGREFLAAGIAALPGAAVRPTAVLCAGDAWPDRTAAAQSAVPSVLLLHGEQRRVFRGLSRPPLRNDAAPEHGLE